MAPILRASLTHVSPTAINSSPGSGKDVLRSTLHISDLPVFFLSFSCFSSCKLYLTGDRNLDPVFALSIGLMAAATRVRREEKEKGRTDAETWASLQRRVGRLFGAEEKAK
ncbi:hypothetical protein K461DRAFT_265479 [Myriangium duriaei CBS 260.36]|uniref:Uncharacterized protein n=1 Tax=Myriangium duriaei CBS 260.36 TaxID=1168546 RepID=A0A9P4MK66_9PEZI|nr:hypothetical protein K461DRAFT_265479 [Myriangium duriaei CBS 260.36]